MQVMQRHLVAGALFSAGIENNDVRNSMLGSNTEDQLDFTVIFILLTLHLRQIL
jgi:hypothetical protein